MFEIVVEDETEVLDAAPVETAEFDLHSYSTFCVMMSGGKDSIGSLLALLEAGVDPAKIELHHQLVDGRESNLMDWPITEGYLTALAKAFNLPLYNSWRVGGIEREMLRDGNLTAPVSFEMPGGVVQTVGGDGGKSGTRLKFPQVGADLRTRWCSGVAKIDVFARVMTNDPRFLSRLEPSRTDAAPADLHATNARRSLMGAAVSSISLPPRNQSDTMSASLCRHFCTLKIFPAMRR